MVADPAGLDLENFAFAAIKPIEIAGRKVTAFRISYVGEQGWELRMKYEDGLAVWDALRSTGVMAFGVETYANSRRLEKSLRLQNADLLTQYNLIEADLARPKVKDVDFRGKAKHLEYKAREHQPAMLCTLILTENTDRNGVKRYPVGSLPVMDPETGAVLVSRTRPPLLLPPPPSPTARRSARTSRLAYLPWSHCQVGRKLNVEYFAETYPVEVAGVGYKPLYDPENLKPRGLGVLQPLGPPAVDVPSRACLLQAGAFVFGVTFSYACAPENSCLLFGYRSRQCAKDMTLVNFEPARFAISLCAGGGNVIGRRDRRVLDDAWCSRPASKCRRHSSSRRHQFGASILIG